MKRIARKPTKPRLRRLSVDIDRRLWSQLDRLRERDGRTIRGIVVQGLRSVLKSTNE